MRAMREMLAMRRVGATFALGLAVLVPACAAAEAATGVVFEDRNGDGARDPAEPGVAGVYVQHGAATVQTDSLGRYSLEHSTDAPNTSAVSPFIVLTRPRGYDVDGWYRHTAGDFALRERDASASDFVFVQMSDAHVSDLAADIGAYGIPGPIGKFPKWLAGLSMWAAIRVQSPFADRDAVAAVLRKGMAERRDVSRMGDTMLMGNFVRDIVDTPEQIVDPVGEFRAALEEIRSMAPAFVVSTGDLVLESNKADAATIERWMRFYARETRATGLRFYDTIGNNELAGTENDDFDVDAPGYGKGMFRASFGPTYYSFDRGALHFIALDTHRHLDPRDDDWSSQEMEEEVRAWLAADLAAHRDRRVVVLNHEPFRADPTWSMPRMFVPEVKDQSWLDEFSVPYTFSGHLHVNGTTSEGGTQHVVTGALSGLRWTLPADAYPRGYRLVQVRGGELYSAWKSLAEPLLGFVAPGDAESHTTAPLSHDPELVVIAAADSAGPFADVSLSVDGEPVALERWSDYFFAATLAEPARHATLRVAATTAGGLLLERELPARAPAPVESCGN